MEKKAFTKRYAQRTHSTPAEAADQVDAVINDLLRRLRAGQPACLPGLGVLQPVKKKKGTRKHKIKGGSL